MTKEQIDERRKTMKYFTNKIAEDWVREYNKNNTEIDGKIYFYDAVKAVEEAVFMATSKEKSCNT